MQDQEFPKVLSSSETPSLRFRDRAPDAHEQRLIVFTLYLLGFVIALVGLVGGFIYGDYYGRKHAQFDNPTLREYYSGQCYAYWENQFKKTVRTSLEKPADAQIQSVRLEEIRSMIQDLQHDVADMATQKAPVRKKMASASLMH
ncbi:MAG TPA: hypothetical protein VE954_22560 [Oligoflexus sp.]|uniref:hypothetical protein n=1 Tax=Oligoflexus sp. TaxID=1971216 RepID=UPI002D24505B|nr:hypothetical protein [Oligoflexus sp.]HYX35892.1 hypothetical protein [Oligoflexus sp.]